MSSYNITRFTRQVLKRYRKEPPSLILHLYPTHFRFEHQHGNFNYDSPMKCFLEAIREQQLPTDLLDVLDQASVRYYEGCLIVEVHDHRTALQPAHNTVRPQQLSFALSAARDQPSNSKAEIYRIVLAPNPATVWTELGIMNEKNRAKAEEDGVYISGWTEEETVELEATILARTAPPLCLSPSIQVTRIANSMLRATTLRPPKRKRATNPGEGGEEAEANELLRREREEYERIMKIGDEGVGRRTNAFTRLAFIQSYRERMNNPQLAGQPPPTASTSAPAPPPASAPSMRFIASVSAPVHRTVHSAGGAGSPTNSDTGRAAARLKKKKYTDSEAGTPGPSIVPPPSASNSLLPISKPKKKQLREDSPANANLDPVERERKATEKKRLAAVKKSNSKARQEKKKREAEASAAAAGESVVWSNGKPVHH